MLDGDGLPHMVVGQVSVGIDFAFLFGNLTNNNAIIGVVLTETAEDGVILGTNDGGGFGKLLGEDDGLGVEVSAVAERKKILIHSSILSGLSGFPSRSFFSFRASVFPSPCDYMIAKQSGRFLPFKTE